jgi:ribosomal protein S15
VTQRKKHRDPYAIAQAKARKAANLSKQEILKKERAATLGDPVRGTETDFLRSFDTALTLDPTPASNATTLRAKNSPDADAPGPSASRDEHLNFFLSKNELEQGIEHSSWLLTPTEEDLRKPTSYSLIGELSEEERRAKISEEQTTAGEAMRRIASLSLASSKDRLRVNTQRCIDAFGRHNTDKVLDPKPAGAHAAPVVEKKERAGPDTGSSEVQVAILTAKIRTLADYCETRGRTDRVNKRNLRLLVHRRQKHLAYLRKKERGGPRWQNLIETLGLTESTWKGEISLGA